MVFTDTLHVVATTLPELHQFARDNNLVRFRGSYYSLPMDKLDQVLQAGARLKLDWELLKIAKKAVYPRAQKT